MSRTLTICFVFLLGYFFISIPTSVQARFAVADFERLNLSQTGCYSGITKEEMQLLLKDANPMMLKRLAEDVEMKNKQIESLRQLLAIACQAVKEGFADDYTVKQELKNIKVELTAINYDREINKDKTPMPPFGYVSEILIKEFYENAGNLADFESFFKIKLQVAKDDGRVENNLAPTEDEVKQAKDYFAKTRIYYTEAQKKANELSKEFWDKVAILVKLQTASFLSRLYSEKVLAEKTKVTEAEIQNYIDKHSELDTKAQKAKAYKILRRVEAGESFAKLAREFSEDPGNKDKGGLYENVKTGQFIPEFEEAALSLKAGEIYPNIVETSYGFHIIKLERKRRVKNEKGEMIWNYDVRHILISTGIMDADNPMSSPIPVKDYVKNKIEEEKQKKALDEILLNNPIVIAEDFEIPKFSDEQIQQIMQQQTQMPQIKVETDDELPTAIKTYLNSNYKGWKLSPSEEGCGVETNNGIVKGNFNADKNTDYAVKITQENKGFIIAFLAQARNYKAFVLHDTDAEDVKYLSLSVWKKGEIFENDEKSFRLRYDAPADYRCESDVGGIHYYQNGKFVGY